MMPVMAYDILEAIGLLASATANFSGKLIAGLEADHERALSFVERSLAMGTALAPELGYEKAAELVKEARATGRTVREVAEQKSGLDPREISRLLDPETQAGQ